MPIESSHDCHSPVSDNHKNFTGEVAIHFSGIEGLNKPIVWMFPQIRVCLDCGVAEFVVPARELQVLTTGRHVEGALISPPKQSERTA